LKEERLKEGKRKRVVEVRKIEGEKLLREVTMKIVLKQEEEDDEIVVKMLLDSDVT